MTNPSTGSPTIRRAPPSKLASMEENVKVSKDNSSVAEDSKGNLPQKKSSTPLSTTSLVNQSFPKKMKLRHDIAFSHPSSESNPMDHLLAKPSEQQAILTKQGNVYRPPGDSLGNPSGPEQASYSNSVPITPATENFTSTAPTTRPASTNINEGNPAAEEVQRLKLELAKAQRTIFQLEAKSEPKGDYGRGSPLDARFACDLRADQVPYRFPSAGPGTTGISSSIPGSWSAYDDSRSDTSDALSATGFNRASHIWNSSKTTQFAGPRYQGHEVPQSSWTNRVVDQGLGGPAISGNGQRGRPEPCRSGPLAPDYDITVRRPGITREARLSAPLYNDQPQYGSSYNHGPDHFEGARHDSPIPLQYPMSRAPYSGPQPAPAGTALSPLASEFTSDGGHWKSENVVTEGPTYLPTTEPLNYRRLLDRNVNCNWKYIVDKIVCNNDQQASIFLQQKLKVGTPAQKYEIVDAIILQAHPLMVNRFGNFLVQRCFEHGTPEQVIKIADAIKGNTLSLSMDPFGCHVVQKAFDSVPEDYKALMVRELLLRIPDTVIHRYACHVWQKLFELRWSESPPQIMMHVNNALCGMWHEVALGETGSLVVQNIFENCLEEDKRPCIEEVLANIDIVAHGQFGNWCIQHICEHGSPADRSRAIDHVIRFAAEYSMDQYASKVVKKCLKIGGNEFLSRYLDRVCEGRVDRPRIPLIDIASDQYGNYLIQWILTNANGQHRDIVAAHIRKHMVSLRGSKFGSRVGMLCTNPAVATRPGPGISNFNRIPGPRYGRP